MKKKTQDIKYQVKVSNEYILAQHDLGNRPQQVILLIAKMIQDAEFKENLLKDAVITIDKGFMLKYLSIDEDVLTRTLKRLRKESIDIPSGFDKTGKAIKYRNTGLIVRFEYVPEKYHFEIEIDSLLRPHFEALGKYYKQSAEGRIKDNDARKFTILNHNEVVRLTGKHSPRLYMLFRKIQYQNIWRKIFTLEELNEIFKTKYRRYGSLNQSLLRSAIEEINDNTCLSITYQARKTESSRKQNAVVFDIHFGDIATAAKAETVSE